MSFRNAHFNGKLDEPITLVEVSQVVNLSNTVKNAGSDSTLGELIK